LSSFSSVLGEGGEKNCDDVVSPPQKKKKKKKKKSQFVPKACTKKEDGKKKRRKEGKKDYSRPCGKLGQQQGRWGGKKGINELPAVHRPAATSRIPP